MKIEHVALDVPDPEAFKDWWCTNLGFRRSSNPGFIMDSSGVAGLEIYRTGETASAPDYGAMDAMTLHVALYSDDVAGDARRLEAAGAKLERLETSDPAFHMAILRDPWGVAVQLCRRAASIALPPAAV